MGDDVAGSGSAPSGRSASKLARIIGLAAAALLAVIGLAVATRTFQRASA